MNFYNYKYHTAILLGAFAAIYVFLNTQTIWNSIFVGTFAFVGMIGVFNYFYMRIKLEKYSIAKVLFTIIIGIAIYIIL